MRGIAGTGSLFATVCLAFLSSGNSVAAVFQCPAADVTCLITSIHMANANGDSDTTLVNVTISGNSAGQGGGIAHGGGDLNRPFSLQNTLIGDNAPNDCSSFSSDNPIASLGNNLIEDLPLCEMCRGPPISGPTGWGRLPTTARQATGTSHYCPAVGRSMRATPRLVLPRISWVSPAWVFATSVRSSFKPRCRS